MIETICKKLCIKLKFQKKNNYYFSDKQTTNFVRNYNGLL